MPAGKHTKWWYEQRFAKRRREASKAAQARHDRLVGSRFGALVVLSRYAGSIWQCRCDCGAEVFVFGYNLERKNTRSCGRTAGKWCCYSSVGKG